MTAQLHFCSVLTWILFMQSDGKLRPDFWKKSYDKFMTFNYGKTSDHKFPVKKFMISTERKQTRSPHCTMSPNDYIQGICRVMHKVFLRFLQFSLQLLEISKQNFTNHGLYGSTSCCISYGPSQLERAIFDPTVPRPLNRFSWNLKYITTSRTRPRMQNFRGLRRRGWSGQIASLTHESFCPFFLLSHAYRSHFWTHPHAQYVLYVVPPNDVPFGVRKMKVETWPLDPQKRENWDF